MENVTKTPLKAEMVKRDKGAYRNYMIVEVPSSSRAGVVYRVDVTNGRCSCPAWIYKKGSPASRPPCKHLKALGWKKPITPKEMFAKGSVPICEANGFKKAA